MSKRLLALLLSVLMLSTAAPSMSALADMTTKADEGSSADVFDISDGVDTDAGKKLALTGNWNVVEWAETDVNSINQKPYEAVTSLSGLPSFDKVAPVPADLYAVSGFEQSSRAAYKTTFKVADAGSNFYIDFDGTNWIASVFVNGTYCGSKKGVRMPWKCDITKAVKAGDNELVIVVKSPKYAIDVPGTIQINPNVSAATKGKAGKVYKEMTKLSDYMGIDWHDCSGVYQDERNTAFISG